MTAIVMVDGIAYTRKEGVPCYDAGQGWYECHPDDTHLAGELVDAHDTIATLRAQLAGMRERVEKAPRYGLGGVCDGDSGYCGAMIEQQRDGDYLDRDDVLAALDGAA